MEPKGGRHEMSVFSKNLDSFTVAWPQRDSPMEEERKTQTYKQVGLKRSSLINTAKKEFLFVNKPTIVINV